MELCFKMCIHCPSLLLVLPGAVACTLLQSDSVPNSPAACFDKANHATHAPIPRSGTIPTLLPNTTNPLLNLEYHPRTVQHRKTRQIIPTPQLARANTRHLLISRIRTDTCAFLHSVWLAHGAAHPANPTLCLRARAVLYLQQRPV